MAGFTFTMPDGTTKHGEGATAQEAWQNANQPKAIGSPGHSPPPDFGSTGANFAAGVGQGLLDPIEGGAQMVGHLPYVGPTLRNLVPQSVSDWTNNFRQRAESTTAGDIGEFAGNVVPFLFQPELGIASRAASLGKVPGFLGRLFERATLPAALQPVPEEQKPRGTPDDFWQDKGIQTLIGTGVGAPFEAIASGLGNVGARAAAERTAAGTDGHVPIRSGSRRRSATERAQRAAG